MFALLTKFARIGHVAVAVVVQPLGGVWLQTGPVGVTWQYWTPSEVIEFTLIWYTWPPLRLMIVMLPWRLVPCLLYLTLNPKLFLRPGVPASCPAELELDMTRKPPPVMKFD